MEIHERIRYLRKEKLDLSQSAFGEALGVSRDVINNIELNRLKNPEQKEPILRLIAEKFSISLSWLKTGEGDMVQQATRQEEIANVVNDAMARSPAEERASLIAHIQKLSDSEIVLLAEIISRLAK